MLAVNPLDAHSLLQTFGALGVFTALFAETGLLIGFFLPGDSLLFTAGLLAATSASSGLHLSLPLVLVAAAGGALLGAQTGYLIGRLAGPRLLDRPDRPRLQAAVRRSDEALARYGPAKAIVLARFIPIVRTFLNPLMGAGQMDAMTFFKWNVLGGVLWGTGVTLLGYFLGNVEFIGKNLEVFAIVIIGISLLPIAAEFLRARRNRV